MHANFEYLRAYGFTNGSPQRDFRFIYAPKSTT